MKSTVKWTFPKTLKFDTYTSFNEKFEKHNKFKNIQIDMTKTNNINSLFVGFLINIQSTLLKNGSRIELHASQSVLKTLNMLKVDTYFINLNEIEKRKSA